MRSIQGTLGAALALALLAATLSPSTARAQTQTSPQDRVAAEALFEDARKLVADGKYAEACPKFADSQRLDPSPATLLNLANCYEKLGRSATAWATFKEAAGAANAAGRADYTAAAERHAAALEPHLARLMVNVAHPVDGMQVTRDGEVVSRPEWGVAIPIDPGSHQVAVSAPGYESWETSIAVAQDGAQATVDVPALKPLPSQAAPPAPAPAPAPVPAPAAAPAPSGASAPAADDGSTGRGQRIAGLVVGGLGVVGLGLGAVYAVVAKNKYDQSLGDCEVTNHDLCNSSGVSLRNDARSAGDVATLSLGLGAAALVAGGVLWFTAPGGTGSHPTGAASIVVAPTLGGAVMRGAF